jgi:quinoprotein dehydrogenase-associated probable ABC transporter substrate-binding protein
MCSAFKSFALACCIGINCAAGADGALRIAADPNNLPFSNDKLEGFENKIAAIIARELGMAIEYEWRAQRRGFFREALKDGNCDLIMGAPAGFERALTTKPYYRSSYVFISRADRKLELTSLDDPKLRELKIGVHLIGDDGFNTPPAHALAERGVITNLVGFTLYGNYAEPNPPARIVQAVSDGSIDLAIVWGPLAGYFARSQTAPLSIFPVPKDKELPFSFAISIGVRKGKKELRDRVDEILMRHREEIQRILREYNVPLDAEP